MEKAQKPQSRRPSSRRSQASKVTKRRSAAAARKHARLHEHIRFVSTAKKIAPVGVEPRRRPAAQNST